MNRPRIPTLVVALVARVSAFGLAACGSEGPPAGCLCEAGQAGQTLWCEACGKGWIDGQPTTDKAAVDGALARLVEKRAEAKGLGGSEVDRIIADIAAGTVKKPKSTCQCEHCAHGEPHDGEHDHDHAHEHDDGAPGEADVPDAEQP